MFRMISYLVAAAALTTGTVAAMAATPDYQVKINKSGDYCVRMPQVTGSLVRPVECQSKADWAKSGVTFQQR